MIANIIPHKRTSRETEIYSYLVPEDLRDNIKIGSIVAISFGRKKITGVIESITTENPDGIELKELSGLTGIQIPAHYIEIARWVADYYLCSLGEAIGLFMPPEMKRPRPQAAERRTQDAGIKQLNAEQSKVFELLKSRLKNPKKPALIHGVTSSGKTEIYLKLAAHTLKTGKQVVVLVPEIILTPQIVERFEETFGDNVALYHSDLSKSEKLNAYLDFQTGVKKIIVGPRSALTVPSENIGLIIIDEEGESSYKQEKNPKYHALGLAEQIAKNRALLVLGSATPTLGSYYKTRTGQYELFELKNRYKNPMPKVEIVDLREEIKNRNFSSISEKLRAAIEETLKARKQTFLFLNRRGASTFVSCRDCGEVVLCPNCSVPLIYHILDKRNFLNCHHCDYETHVPSQCPVCKGFRIKYFGAGVEKIEMEIKKLFPEARIRRIDSSTMNSKRDYQNLYDDLKNHKIDILIGTQIIAKGLDIPNVDLVGIVSADVGLHLPYYKAAERTFQLITQVIGRGGRGDNHGKAILQTYWPESLSILSAGAQNFESFYNREIEERKKYDLPPFVHLVRVIAEEKQAAKAKEEVLKVAKECRKKGIEYLGPAKAFFSKIRGNYRYHLIIKTKDLPDKKIEEIFLTNPYLYWDVDPENLL